MAHAGLSAHTIASIVRYAAHVVVGETEVVAYQLVRASEDEIVIWHTDHGHIFGFQVVPHAHDLLASWTRDIPEAPERAATLEDEAKLFALQEARSRRMIG